MHILLLPSWYPMETRPLIGTFFQEQASALKSMELKVGVVAVNQQPLKDIGKPLFNNGLVSKTVHNDIPTYIQEIRSWLPRIPYGNAFLSKRAFHRIIDLYIEEHGVPDIIHAHSVFFGGYAAVTHKLKIKTILTEHNSGFVRGRFNRGWQKNLVNSVLQKVLLKISVSNFFSNALWKQYPKHGEWVTIPNIVDKRFFLKPIKSKESSDLTFLNIGFLTPVKGQRSLLTAFASLLNQVPNCILNIGGDGPLKAELIEYARNLGIEEKVFFLGNLTRSQVQDHMLSSDFFVLNSNFETFGVVLIEALASGLPVLSTKSGGPQDIINDSNGILVDNHDHDALVDGLLTLCENKNQYNKVHIRDDCYNRFSEESVARTLTNTYLKVLQV